MVKEEEKQRSTNTDQKAKDRATQTPLKTGSELRCPGRVSSSFFTSDVKVSNL
jgi:hypothetical protein